MHRAMARTGRILVVDDEVNARTALAELLRDEGYDIETAADAFKALGKYESFAPHVVVTDLKMPGMDGIELVKKIRAMEDPAAIVVMTAFGAVASAAVSTSYPSSRRSSARAVRAFTSSSTTRMRPERLMSLPLASGVPGKLANLAAL